MDLVPYTESKVAGEKQDVPPLCWSSEPNKNFVDWTIVVTSMPSSDDVSNNTGEDSVTLDADRSEEGPSKKAKMEPETTIYYVHKAILGLGPRSSSYFRNLFSTNGMAESVSSESRLELHPSAARAFPTMLDFMYARVDVAATTETAVALRHLANYFDIPSLIHYVNSFIINDMNESNIHIYVGEAQMYHDETTVNQTMAIACKNWRDLFISEDAKSWKSHIYLKILDEGRHAELFRMSMVHSSESYDELRRFKRLTDESVKGLYTYDRSEPVAMPAAFPRARYGRNLESGLPLFYYDPNKDIHDDHETKSPPVTFGQTGLFGHHMAAFEAPNDQNNLPMFPNLRNDIDG